MNDNLEDRAICEALAILIARELAADIRDNDPTYSPWGGLFSKKETYSIPIGSC